jgi:hypothetical protein
MQVVRDVMTILAMEAQALGLDRGCSRVACSFVRMALYGSGAMLAFNPCVVAFFETRNPDISSISVWEVCLGRAETILDTKRRLS